MMPGLHTIFEATPSFHLLLYIRNASFPIQPISSAGLNHESARCRQLLNSSFVFPLKKSFRPYRSYFFSIDGRVGKILVISGIDGSVVLYIFIGIYSSRLYGFLFLQCIRNIRPCNRENSQQQKDQ